ncbi:MAG: hypothetical protein IKU65_03990 [Oscillospiraceae bacterium]|nr:hypothetical protein [Oscillospiraceae bacterium]
MTKRKNSIKGELEKIVRKKISPEEASQYGLEAMDTKNMSILRAIAMAQVKRGLEGDLKAAVFIEELLGNDEDGGSATPFDVVVKVVGERNGD